MSDTKRFLPYVNIETVTGEEMYLDADGEFVLYEDYAALRADRDALLEIEKMRDEEIASLREAHGTALVERDALQARIDSLMLEYCPDEMTSEQIETYESHQRPFIQPAGMMLVPVELTPEMIRAFHSNSVPSKAWKAMLSAAPAKGE